MTKKIDNRLIAQISKERPVKVREIRDSTLKGFLVRQQTSGTISYFVSIHRGTTVRKQRRIRVGIHPETSPSKARSNAEIKLAEARLGQLAENKPMMTLAEFLDEKYLPWMESNLGNPDAQREDLERHFWGWRPLKLNEINRELLDNWRSKRRKDEVTPNTINRNVCVIRSVLSKAVEWEVLEFHPLTGLKPLRVDKGKPIRMLTEDERARLLKALAERDKEIQAKRRSYNEWRRVRRYNLYPELPHFGDYLTPIILTAYHTGMRRGEILSLRWDDISFDQAQLTVRGEISKTAQTRVIPLNTELHDILKNWKQQTEEPTGLVFPGPNGQRLEKLRNSWPALRKRAGLTDFRFHDLRADFASRLVNGGVSLPIAQRLLGHSSPVVTMKFYAAVSGESLREAVSIASGA